jgi:DNA-binding NtrC family response regulator
MAHTATGARPHILIVEDEPLIRWNAEVVLAAAGFTILSAPHAAAALLLLVGRSDIAVVFSDIAMPGPHDGAELAVMVHARWPAIGIVLTSGHERRLPLGLGERARFIAKPYRDDELIAAISGVMG